LVQDFFVAFTKKHNFCVKIFYERKNSKKKNRYHPFDDSPRKKIVEKIRLENTQKKYFMRVLHQEKKIVGIF
jgi:hypothetical protein